MKQSIVHIALVVRDYDEAIEFFCHKLHFTLIEDTYQPEQDKRWVLVAPRRGRDALSASFHPLSLVFLATLRLGVRPFFSGLTDSHR